MFHFGFRCEPGGDCDPHFYRPCSLNAFQLWEEAKSVHVHVDSCYLVVIRCWYDKLPRKDTEIHSRCNTVLIGGVLRRSRFRPILLQVYSGRLLVGRRDDDDRGLWWYEVTFSVTCYRCRSLLQCCLLCRSGLGKLLLQVDSRRVLVGCSHYDYSGLRWYDVRCTHFHFSYVF